MIGTSFILLLALCLVFVFAEIPIEEGVLVLDEDNFDEAISSNSDGLLVEFYAPWCGHCKQLAPEWAKAAQVLRANASPIKLAKVDATEAKDLASKYDVRGFPTIKFLRNGQSSDYQGGRTESEIVSWVTKKSSPAFTLLASEEEFMAFQENHEVFVLGVFSGEDASADFKSLAQGDELFTWAITYDESVKSKLGVSKDTVVVIKTSEDFEEKRSDYSLDDGFDAAEVKAFVLGETTPLIQEFSQESAKKIFSSPVNKHILFFTDKAASHHKTTLDSLKVVAKEFKGKALFVNVPASENRILEFFGLKSTDLPTVILADMGAESGLKKYPYVGELESAPIIAFLTSFFDGTLKPTLKSEPVSPDDTTGPVTILKGSSFADLVINNTKDVFVEFYAPWCGHCKKLSPIWDDLGAEYESNENIVIAKMDSTANEIDVPGINVKGFPTLIFFPSGSKSQPVTYSGARELEDLINYVEEHSVFTKTDESGSDEL